MMAPLLDPESVITENQLRAMRMMDLKDSADETKNLRTHKEDGFEHIFQLQLPDRPEIVTREEPVNWDTWNGFRSGEGRFSGTFEEKCSEMILKELKISRNEPNLFENKPRNVQNV